MLLRMMKAPMTFLSLEDECGVKLLFHNLIATGLLTLMLSAPFIVFSTANFFHKDGFLDKVSSFSSVLTGFYVAGLVAVAAFSPALGDIDAKIEQGSVTLRSYDDDIADHELTRREYASYLFGYLAFLSLCVTLLGILVVIIAGSFNTSDLNIYAGKYHVSVTANGMRGLGVVATAVVLSHMFIVTVQGIYYLTERVYARNPETLPETLPDPEDDEQQRTR